MPERWGAEAPCNLIRARVPAGVRFHDDRVADWNACYARGGFKRRLGFVDGALRELVRPGAAWLDAGCGAGVLTRRLAALGAHGDAVDASPAMIRAATEQAGDGAPTAFAYRRIDSVEHLDTADATYDGVLCSSVIEYVDEPAAALGELTRVLKPGGRLLVSVANRRSLTRGAERAARVAGRVIGKDLFAYLDVSRAAYTRGGIRAALQARGVRVDDIHGFDPVLPAWTVALIPPALLFVVGTKARG